MRLDELFSGLIDLPATRTQTEITGITTDPRLCQPGFLYVAAECETVDSTRYGVRLNGRDFVDIALKNGAHAILSTPDLAIPPEYRANTAYIAHSTPLVIFGPLAARFYGAVHPKVVALVTGTNGKTSTVNFCKDLWTLNNLPACSVGNLGGVCSDGTIVWDRDPTLSVPETVTLHKMLNRLACRGIDHVALEATSHALFDNRLDGVPVNIAAFSNLTRDHLDFHGTMEEYFRVKMTLFRNVLPPGSHAVLNADDPWFAQARQICTSCNHNIISYGWQGDELRLISLDQQPEGQQLDLEIFGKRHVCQLNLFGQFQAINVLCSLSIVLASGVPVERALAAVPRLTAIEGRLSLVAVAPSGGKVIVDYAHSPDAIRAALEGCRTFTRGSVSIVFGCNGERDEGKRSQMGEMAARLADKVIITDGHPRTEDPACIRAAVKTGAPDATEIADRAKAIEYGIRSLGPEDTLLIAGMGHENFQTIGTVRTPYSDSQTAKRIVAGLSQAASNELQV